ncbi:hypothetical protein [Streptomyces sp. AA1529]|nr:hypothetical protein [Streptomyces sp. AA1529]
MAAEQDEAVQVLRKGAVPLHEGEQPMSAVYAFIEAEKTTASLSCINY